MNLPLSNSLIPAVIDPEDEARCIRHTWRINRRYPRAKVAGRMTELHRFLMDAPAEMHVDHINGDPLDNRRANLRLATNAQNQRNQIKRATATSRFKGVNWNRQKLKWRATIFIEKKQKFLGHFTTEEAAARAYDTAAAEHFGDFARGNFKQEHLNRHIEMSTL